MKPSSQAIGALLTSLLPIIGITLIARRINLYNNYVAFPTTTSGQAAGQQGRSNLTLEQGGVLQQNLDQNQDPNLEQATPEEFLIENTGTGNPHFLNRKFTVHVDKIVKITLNNQSTVNHSYNWVLVQPGTKDEVQNAALVAGSDSQWIPDTPHVLAYIPTTKPGASVSILFRAPSETGDYPFLCTLPGYGNVMNGVLQVRSSQ